MALQIVIPGTFTAPGLPDLGMLGFVDTFSRGNSTTSMGYTETPRREWTYGPPGAGVVSGIRAGQAYVARGTGVGFATATVDAEVADGALEGTIGTHVTTSGAQLGLAFRHTSINDMWRFVKVQEAFYRLTKVAGGTTTNVADSEGITPAMGDRLRVVLNGPSITCYVNDQPAVQATDTFNAAVTWHGIVNNNTTDNTMDNVSFTA